MVRWRAAVSLAGAGMLLAAIACSRKATVSPVDAGVVPAKQEAELPFERIAQKTGISPTSSVIPPGANIPIGTPLAVRLKYALSSARQRSGDRFEALLEEPLVLNGETLVPSGTMVTGRVIEARRASRSKSPGYLRLALTSVPVLGKIELVQTSSAFLKAASAPRIDLSHAHLPSGGGGVQVSTGGYSDESAATGIMSAANARVVTAPATRDVVVGTDHRLIFRLTEPVALPQSE